MSNANTPKKKKGRKGARSYAAGFVPNASSDDSSEGDSSGDKGNCASKTDYLPKETGKPRVLFKTFICLTSYEIPHQFIYLLLNQVT